MMEPTSSTPEPEEDESPPRASGRSFERPLDRPLDRMMGGQRSSRRSSGLKPFVLIGLVVVIGLLVSLGALMRRSDQAAGDLATESARDGGLMADATMDEEPTPGAMTIGRPESEKGGASSASPAGSAPSGSEFTFYETLKKGSQDPDATVGLAPKSNPPKAEAPAPKPAAEPKLAALKPTAKPKPASRVIETAGAQNGSIRYTVQVGAFRQQPVAEEMIAKLNKKGHDAYLMVTQLSDGVTYRVRVGKFATREEANKAAQGLASQEGVTPFVATIQAGT